MSLASTDSHVCARRIRVAGIVQGVGFRPFVKNLADQFFVKGWVLNDNFGVLVHASASLAVLDEFCRRLVDDAPVLARVDGVKWEVAHPEVTDSFVIQVSDASADCHTLVPPDAHICEDCLKELFDPSNRRYQYPFINCTNCGPRYSLIRQMPYDRAETTMAVFEMCSSCAMEYENVQDRRYHAQPNACPDCGPKLTFQAANGGRVEREDALESACQVLRQGGILGVKSVGGYHLAVDAQLDDAVRLLRKRKLRDGKPFAVMVSDLAQVEAIARTSAGERQLLNSPARPIVLLQKNARLPESVAPRNPNIGVMLASAPLHHLLLRGSQTSTLVMTSGNVSGRPIEYQDDDAQRHLFSVCDGLLFNDREIFTRVDDSVVRLTQLDSEGAGRNITFIRKSRGYVPYTVGVGAPLRKGIAYGAELKTTVAVSRGAEIVVSQHIGDLKNHESRESHERCAIHLAGLLDVEPEFVACDLHPNFRSTSAAEAFGKPVMRVQHHHAHMAACMAENGLQSTTLGVIFDGAGYGLDGTVWGGEFLLGDFHSVERVGRLRTIPLIGGDRAVHEPIRTGFALAHLAEVPSSAFPGLGKLDADAHRVYTRMLQRAIQTPLTSSAGRLFDGVAALLNVCSHAEYEAQGPIELEGLLQRDLTMVNGYGMSIGSEDTVAVVDWVNAVRGIAQDLGRGVAVADIARRFHSTVVEAVLRVCERERTRVGIEQVVLSGGVFLNEFLIVNTCKALKNSGFDVFSHHAVPPNDACISVGQLMVANARFLDDSASA